MNTQWRVIEGTPYAVSEYGDVIRLEKGSYGQGGKILKHRLLRTGYHRVNLCYNGKQQDRYIHRLVAEAFICKGLLGDEINHIDGNKDNNHVA